MSAPSITPDQIAYARQLLADEKQRQHLIAEQNERDRKTPGIEAWRIESYARQERDARTGERLLGELLRALPKDGS